MKIIRSLFGRRQFLIAAGAASTSVLALGKFASVVDPVFQTRAVHASDIPETNAIKGAGNRYNHLLSPLKIRNIVVKNRMIATVGCIPHFLQGPETFPSDVIRSYYANVAKGAAIVTCRLGGGRMMARKEQTGDSAHMMMFDSEDPAVTNYIDQMVEGIHCMGSLVSGGNLGRGPGGIGDDKDIVTQAKSFEDKGFDVVGMGVPDLQDKDRVRLTIEQMQSVKNATNLLIMVSMVVIDPSVRAETSDSGQNITSFITMEDAVSIAKTFEDSVDILFIKIACGMNNHPTSLNMEKGKPAVLHVSQAIKESGAKIITAPNGGFRDPDLNEDYISRGKTDMIAMARSFICDPAYGKKIYDARGEDTIPCIMCNKCHGLSLAGPWYSVCSVNPELGIESAIKVIDAPASSKKVAVIGGGPAGMKAAIVAAERGHKVTLYEKNDYLGGLLRHSDFSPFKWALKDYKDYLIHQVKKAGVDVLLNTEATPDMIKAKRYDTVLAAVGSEPVIPKISGANKGNIWNVVNVYGKEKELGKNVVVIGGGEFGVETGMYLANAGHNTTMLTIEKELLHNDHVHYPEQIIDCYEHLESFDFILEAIPTRISEGKVTYLDAKDNEKYIQADSVVIYGGLRPRQDEALKFYGSAKYGFFAAGDCTGKGGNVQKSIRSAFFTASLI